MPREVVESTITGPYEEVEMPYDLNTLPNLRQWENTMFMLENHPGTLALQTIARDQDAAKKRAKWWEENQVYVLAGVAAVAALVIARR